MSRMTNLTDTNSSVFSYEFDGEGNRTRQNLNDCLETRFVYDGPNVVMELNGSNEVVCTYVLGLGVDQPIERIDFINGTARKRQVFHTDGLGSITLLTDEDGESIQSYAYDAFGKIRAQTGSELNRITFTAREALGDSLGFYYYRNRIYNPNAGRFASEDPLGFVNGADRYIYCINNPVMYVDPDGQIVWFIPVIGAVVGGVANAIQNYNAYMAGNISGANYAKSIAFGAGAEALVTFVPGVSGVVAGSALAGANNLHNQSINNNFNGYNMGQVYQSCGYGLAGGMVGYGIQSYFTANLLNTTTPGYVGQNINSSVLFNTTPVSGISQATKIPLYTGHNLGAAVGASVGNGISSLPPSQPSLQPCP